MLSAHTQSVPGPGLVWTATPLFSLRRADNTNIRDTGGPERLDDGSIGCSSGYCLTTFRERERESRRFKSFTLLLKWCCYFQSIDGDTCCLNVCWTEWTFSRVYLKYHIPINTHIYTWTNVCSLSVEDVMKKVVFKEIVSQSIVLSFYWKYCKFKVFDFPQN